jgi:hypothetical protein
VNRHVFADIVLFFSSLRVATLESYYSDGKQAPPIAHFPLHTQKDDRIPSQVFHTRNFPMLEVIPCERAYRPIVLSEFVSVEKIEPFFPKFRRSFQPQHAHQIQAFPLAVASERELDTDRFSGGKRTMMCNANMPSFARSTISHLAGNDAKRSKHVA